jgi:hypothetical protein
LPRWSSSCYYAVRLRGDNRIEIIRRLDGVTKALGSHDASVLTNVNNRVRFEAIGAWLRVYVDGLRVLLDPNMDRIGPLYGLVSGHALIESRQLLGATSVVHRAIGTDLLPGLLFSQGLLSRKRHEYLHR